MEHSFGGSKWIALNWPNVRAPPIDFAHTLTAATDARVLLPRFPRRACDL
jgi:hypothetical protein